MARPSVIVVGAGLSGSAAAWRLAERGHEVTVLERRFPANPWGSSHGSARIFRYAYADPFYAELVVAARQGWDDLEAGRGSALIARTGGLDHGALRDPAALAPILDGIGVAHEILAADAAAARWPGIAFHGPVLFHPDAGVLDAASAVEEMLRRAQAAGARVETFFTVDRIEPDGAGYRVVSASGEAVSAEQVVVAAGGWLPELLGGLGLSTAEIARLPEIVVRQEQVVHLPYRTPPAPDGDAGTWPIVIHKEPGREIYTLPGGRDAAFRGQKLAQFQGGRIIRSASEHDRVVDPAGVTRLVEYARRELPGLVPEPYAEATCLFTSTPTEDFVVDRVGGITILSPCSGHGAKFAPAIGELVARLVAADGAVPRRFRPVSAAA